MKTIEQIDLEIDHAQTTLRNYLETESVSKEGKKNIANMRSVLEFLRSCRLVALSFIEKGNHDLIAETSLNKALEKRERIKECISGIKDKSEIAAIKAAQNVKVLDYQIRILRFINAQ